ncbi:MAG: NAD(P)-dependent oxidoreductase [Candidatus Nezhaarchaeota archaeon]|nr:NAD(P)-dependent oxidoreductase [Candidatus Nezhaarchaeota archaeon]
MVIGGTGHVGSHIVRRLVAEGLDVVVLSRFGDTSRIGDVADKVKNVKGSTTELGDLLSALKEHGVRCVVYSAAEHPWAWTPHNVVNTMIRGFLNVLEAARLMDLEKLVWTSSYAQLGPPHLYGKARLSEDDPVKPMVIHGTTYVVNEFMSSYYAEKYGMDVLALRLGLVFGPGRERRGFGDILVDLFENPVLGKPVKVSKADTLITPQYVKEAANVVHLALKAKGYRHRVFNTCDEVVSLRQLAEWVLELVPHAQIALEPGDETPRALVDASRIREELGYKPVYTVREGVVDYINILMSKSSRKTQES